MGILNLSPDSFFDGGVYSKVTKALTHIKKMLKNGADIIDIGAESSRPESLPISTDEEINRLLPTLSALKDSNINCLISIDTYKPEVAEFAINFGATIINDIYAMDYNQSKMIELLKKNKNVKIILMHRKFLFEKLKYENNFDVIFEEIIDYFFERITILKNNKINKNRIILDPGIGFGKSAEQSLYIIKNIHKLKSLGFPVCIGASRKSFFNNIYLSKPKDRLIGTLASSLVACLNNIDIIRVHDPKENNLILNSFLSMYK
jgi:dihydropteroate synthase